MPLSYRTIHNQDEMLATLALARMEELQSEKRPIDTKPVDVFPSLYSIHTFTFIGSFAWTNTVEQWKIVNAKNAILTSLGWKTPAEIARDYVASTYSKPGRVKTTQYQEFMRHRTAPLFALPGVYEKSLYLDLKSAYWSILQVIGWDVDYFPGKWLSVKSDNRDFPYWKNKLARNCLVSVGVSGKGKAWDGSKLVFHSKQNKYTNNMLWAAVQDVLAGVAHDMKRAGAVYIHTDGYIVEEKNYVSAMEVFDTWGLVGTIRSEGRHEVIGAGTYSSPNKPNNRMANMTPKAFENINPVQVDWLRDRFGRFAHKRPLLLG